MTDPYDEQLQEFLAAKEAARLEVNRGEVPTTDHSGGSSPQLSAAVQASLTQLAEFDERLRGMGLPVGDEDAEDHEQRQTPVHETLSARDPHVSTHPTGRIATARLRPDAAGRYRIERELGSGGFGAVFLGWDTQLSRAVAIKMPNAAGSGTDGEELFKEARAFAALEHPNIVPVYDVGKTKQGLPYLVMKHMEGASIEGTSGDGPIRCGWGSHDCRARGRCRSPCASRRLCAS